MARSVGAARAGCCWAGRVEKKRVGWAGLSGGKKS
jgi:hypothetical protein